MARYKMIVVFDTNEKVAMRYVHRQEMDVGKVTLAYEPVERSDDDTIVTKEQPHINKLYEDVIERIETSPKHPITYDIVSFEKLKEE